MYMDSSKTVENKAAQAAAQAKGIEYNCDDPKLAVPECFVAANWNGGWVGEMTHKILTSLGVNVIALTRANFSQEVFQVYEGSSSFTRCVYEVRLENVDLCVGDFWETNERRRVSPFTSAFDLDTMTLLTMPAGTVSDKFDPVKFLDIFRPFKAEVWALLLGMMVFGGVCAYVVELGSGSEDYAYEEGLSSPVLRHLLGVTKSIYLAMFGFLSGGPTHVTTGWPGRLIALGFGVFIYISVASYSASLVSFLISSNKAEGKIESMRDLKTKGGKLCVLEAMAPLVTDVTKANKLTFDNWGPATEKLHSGGCIAAILGKQAYQMLIVAQDSQFSVCVDKLDPKGHSECADPIHEAIDIDLNCQCSDATRDPATCPDECPYYHRYCNILEVLDGDFQLAIGNALPVNQTLMDYVSAWIVQERLNGNVQKLRKRYVTDTLPPRCNKKKTKVSGLTIEQMGGTYVITSVLIVLGLIAQALQLVIYREKREEGAAEGAAEG
eukprot:CAMPEP_0181313226 /NCGR_PEP_ID=MMETSP1101-20121128/14134_1 /TAXON_ID=46948 /ORGANISM="Rhodomonas abbreviata, Strain Caron Lab Isolate" /LENGTH=494 /DNA_ID=CAMNT_0023420163 /DNA_START=273 /DNA_END=1753 /DNA_ORIENTATION=+